MNLFVNADDRIKFSLFVTVDCGKLLVTDAPATEANLVGYTELTFEFRKPSYKDTVAIMRGNLTTDGSKVAFDPATMRYERMVVLIKDWSLCAPAGDKVQPSQENIDRLDPVLADAIASKLEAMLQ
jgi:hypothetical protein